MRKLFQTMLAITFACLVGYSSMANAGSCSLTPSANSDIIRGARIQNITLNAGSDCFATGRNVTQIKLTRNEVSISGILKREDDKSTKAVLSLDQIHGTLPLGEVEFEIFSSEAAASEIKKISLHIDEISIANSTVTYSDIEKNLKRSQQQRKMPLPPIGSGLPIAVASPIVASYSEANAEEAEVQIVNHTYLNIPNSLATSTANDVRWKITATTPADPQLKLVNKGTDGKESLGRYSCLDNPREISYVINQQYDSRIRVKLELVRNCGDKPADNDKSPVKPLFLMEIDLADSARTGIGQPVRISDLISVVCGKPGAQQSDVATNGVTHAISRNLMSQGQCYIYIDPCNGYSGVREEKVNERVNRQIEQNLTRVASKLLTSAADRQEDPLTPEIRLMYNLYGAQNLFVTVERQGVSGKWEGRWTVEPSSWSCRPWGRSIPGPTANSAGGQGQDPRVAVNPQNQSPVAYTALPRPSTDWKYQPAEALLLKPPPTDQGGGEEVYQIHVQAAARSPVVEYADGVVVPSGDGMQYLSPEYQFDARLRPSGLFGLPYKRGGFWDGRSARIFVTLPIEGVSLRFPTSLRDLHSTSDSTSVQVVTLRAGALLTIEPWDYNRGENFFAIPLRFQAGGHLIDLGSGSFTPSLLIGFSAALPLVQTSVKFAQTTVGLGAFYELDGRDGSSHALLTVGLNLLSLFSPPAGVSN